MNLRIPDFEELGLPPVVQEFANRKSGLVLVTGPTGSGKSTTLAAIVNKINMERAAHIITLEEPIEYLHRHQKSIVNQREVGSDTRSFAAGLRAALRQGSRCDIDGRDADLETISTAITALLRRAPGSVHFAYNWCGQDHRQDYRCLSARISSNK